MSSSQKLLGVDTIFVHGCICNDSTLSQVSYTLWTSHPFCMRKQTLCRRCELLLLALRFSLLLLARSPVDSLVDCVLCHQHHIALQYCA